VGALLTAPAIVQAANIRKARFPGWWRPTQVPVGIRCAIDRSHPLGQTLLCAYAPGTQNAYTDIAGVGPALAPRTNGGLLTTAIGVANNGNGSNPTGAASVARPPSTLERTTAITLAWVGQVIAAHSSQPAPLFGFGDSAGAPFYSYNVAIVAGATPTICALYNNAGSFVEADGTTAFPLTGVSSGMVTFPMGGATGSFYVNGAAAGTYTNNGTPTFAATDQIVFAAHGFDLSRIVLANSNLGVMWAGALPTDMAQWFAAEPFAMLKPFTLDDRVDTAAVGSGAGGMILLGVGR
jgi:hypothetical protein